MASHQDDDDKNDNDPEDQEYDNTEINKKKQEGDEEEEPHSEWDDCETKLVKFALRVLSPQSPHCLSSKIVAKTTLLQHMDDALNRRNPHKTHSNNSGSSPKQLKWQSRSYCDMYVYSLCWAIFTHGCMSNIVADLHESVSATSTTQIAEDKLPSLIKNVSLSLRIISHMLRFDKLWIIVNRYYYPDVLILVFQALEISLTTTGLYVLHQIASSKESHSLFTQMMVFEEGTDSKADHQQRPSRHANLSSLSSTTAFLQMVRHLSPASYYGIALMPTFQRVMCRHITSTHESVDRWLGKLADTIEVDFHLMWIMWMICVNSQVGLGIHQLYDWITELVNHHVGSILRLTSSMKFIPITGANIPTSIATATTATTATTTKHKKQKLTKHDSRKTTNLLTPSELDKYTEVMLSLGMHTLLLCSLDTLLVIIAKYKTIKEIANASKPLIESLRMIKTEIAPRRKDPRLAEVVTLLINEITTDRSADKDVVDEHGWKRHVSRFALRCHAAVGEPSVLRTVDICSRFSCIEPARNTHKCELCIGLVLYCSSKCKMIGMNHHTEDVCRSVIVLKSFKS